MSLLLDVCLFFRNSKTKLNLSLANRAIILIFAGRVGSNADTWVKQETLAKECGIHRQNLVEPIKKIIGCGLIYEVDKKKRKKQYQNAKGKVYAFSDLIKNYHQRSDNQKRKIHEHFKDEFFLDESADEELQMSGKPDIKKNQMSGKPDIQMSGKPDMKIDYVLPVDPIPIGLDRLPLFPKATLESKNKRESTNIYRPNVQKNYTEPEQINSDICPPGDGRVRKEAFEVNCEKKTKKRSQKIASEILESFERFYEIYPRKEAKLRALKAWTAKKCTENEAVILSDVRERTSNNWAGRAKNHIPMPETYINQERWTDEIIPPEQRKTYAQSKIDRNFELLRQGHERDLADERRERELRGNAADPLDNELICPF